MSKSITIKGLSKLKRNLKRIPVVAVQTGARELEGIAADIKADAATMAPVETGALADSITIDGSSNARRARYMVKTGEPYAGFVEFGTNDTAAEPFMRPAAEKAAKRLPASAKRIATKLEGIH